MSENVHVSRHPLVLHNLSRLRDRPNLPLIAASESVLRDKQLFSVLPKK